ncbi:MAG: succinate--CoA ligase subunit beta, partial [Rickettsiales bacterium]
MNIHEYQAKAVLAKYGVPVPNGHVAYSPEEAVEAAKKLDGDIKVVKAQIHAGGRGKAGGVKLAKTLDEVKQYATDMLGMTLVTHQTGPEGKEVRRLYIEEGSDIKDELYLSVVVDRDTSRVTFMASVEGGVEIEEVAAKTPEKIIMVSIDPACGFQPFHARKLAFGLGMSGGKAKELAKFTKALYEAFTDTDASQLEINPLVVTGDDKIIALDAKFNFDENALFRHPDIAELRDEDEEEPLER